MNLTNEQLRVIADRIIERYGDELVKALTDETPWWEQLPPNTPVEVCNGSYQPRVWLLEPAQYADQYDHVRWPTPPDGWAYARKNGFGWLFVRDTGEVELYYDKIITEEKGVFVPIPPEKA